MAVEKCNTESKVIIYRLLYIVQPMDPSIGKIRSLKRGVARSLRGSRTRNIYKTQIIRISNIDSLYPTKQEFTII